MFTKPSKLLMCLWGIKLSPIQNSDVINFNQIKRTFHQSLEINSDRIPIRRLLVQRLQAKSSPGQTIPIEQTLSQKQLICGILTFIPITIAQSIEKCLPMFHLVWWYLHSNNNASIVSTVVAVVK